MLAVQSGLYTEDTIASLRDTITSPLQSSDPHASLDVVGRLLREASPSVIPYLSQLLRNVALFLQDVSLSGADQRGTDLVTKAAETVFGITRSYGISKEDFDILLHAYISYQTRNMTVAASEAHYLFTLSMCHSLNIYSPLRYSEGEEPNRLTSTLRLEVVCKALDNALLEVSRRNIGLDVKKNVKGHLSMVITALATFMHRRAGGGDTALDLLAACMCPMAPPSPMIPSCSDCCVFKYARVLLPPRSAVGIPRLALTSYWHDITCYILESMLPVIKHGCDADKASHFPEVVIGTAHLRHSNVLPNILRLITMCINDANSTTSYPRDGLCLSSATQRIQLFFQKYCVLHIQDCLDAAKHAPTDHYLTKTMTAYVAALTAQIRDEASAFQVVVFLDTQQADCPELRIGSVLAFLTSTVRNLSAADPTLKNKKQPHPNITFCAQALQLLEAVLTFASPRVLREIERHNIPEVMMNVLVTASCSPEILRGIFSVLAACSRQTQIACAVWRGVEDLQVLRTQPVKSVTALMVTDDVAAVGSTDVRTELEREHRDGRYPQTIGFLGLLHWMTSSTRSIRHMRAGDAPSLKPYVEYVVECMLLCGGQRSELSVPNDKWHVLSLGCMILRNCLDDCETSTDSLVFLLIDVVCKSKGTLDREPYGSLRESTLCHILTFLHYVAFNDPSQHNKVRVAQRMSHNSDFVTALAHCVNSPDLNVVFAATQFLYVIACHGNGGMGRMLYTLHQEDAVRHAFTVKLHANDTGIPGPITSALSLWRDPVGFTASLDASVKSAIMRLIIKEIPVPFPSVASLLCGYPTSNVEEMLTQSCLEVILQRLHSEEVATNQQAFHALCLECVCKLLTHDTTATPQLQKFIEGRGTRVFMDMLALKPFLSLDQLGWLMHILAAELINGTIAPRSLPPLASWLESAASPIPNVNVPQTYGELPVTDITGVPQYNLENVALRVPISTPTVERDNILQAFLRENLSLRRQYSVEVFTKGWALAVQAVCVKSELPCSSPEALRSFAQCLLAVFAALPTLQVSMHIAAQCEAVTLSLLQTAAALLHALTLSKDPDLGTRTNAECVAIVEGVCNAVVHLRYSPSCHVLCLAILTEFLQSRLTHSQVCVLIDHRAAVVNACVQSIVRMSDPILSELALVCVTTLTTTPTLQSAYLEAMCESPGDIPLRVLVSRGLPALDSYLARLLDAPAKDPLVPYILVAERFFGLLTTLSNINLDTARAVTATGIIQALEKSQLFKRLGGGGFRPRGNADVDAACAVMSPVLEMWCALMAGLLTEEGWGATVALAECVSQITQALQVLLEAFLQERDATHTKYTLPFCEKLTRLFYLFSMTIPVGRTTHELIGMFQLPAVYRHCQPGSAWRGQQSMYRIVRNVACLCAYASRAVEDSTQYVSLGNDMTSALMTSLPGLADALGDAGATSGHHVLLQAFEMIVVVLYCEGREETAPRAEVIATCERLLKKTQSDVVQSVLQLLRDAA